MPKTRSPYTHTVLVARSTVRELICDCDCPAHTTRTLDHVVGCIPIFDASTTHSMQIRVRMDDRCALTDIQVRHIIQRGLVFLALRYSGTPVMWTTELASAYARTYDSNAVPAIHWQTYTDREGRPARRVVLDGVFVPETARTAA